MAHYAGSTDYTTADSAAVPFSIGQATPSVSVTDAGGTYNASAYAATGATVTGVDGSLASFGDGSLSYTYYDVLTSTSLGSTAPTNAGSYTVVAHYAGSADYAAADSAAVPFSIAKATPSVSVTSATNPVNIANEAAVTVSGTAEDDANISLVVSNGSITTDAYTTAANGDGRWSIPSIDVSSLADGTITYTVTATDPAGNFSTGDATATATKDTVAPTVTVTPLSPTVVRRRSPGR